MQSVERWPAGVACRVVALRWLGDVAGAAERLVAGSDGEALHDFRVGLRRLRVTLKAYRSLLEDTVPAKRRKNLRRIARATGATRDLEVQRAWLAVRDLRSQAEADARDDLLERMEDGSAGSDGLDRVLRRFRKQERRLRTELAHVNVGPLLSDCTPDLFGPTTVRVATVYLEHLAASLAGIACEEDDVAIHAARIRTKRLRYLLEPFRSTRPTCASACGCLGTLQDVLGDLRDMSLLARRIDAAKAEARGEHLIAGYVLLAWRVRRSRLDLFTTLQRRWLRPGALEGAAAAVRVLKEGGGSVAEASHPT